MILILITMMIIIIWYIICIHIWDCFFAKSRRRLQFPGPTPIVDRRSPPIVIGCPPSPLVGSKFTMYAYTYIFGACGGQLLGFRNWHQQLIGLLWTYVAKKSTLLVPEASESQNNTTHSSSFRHLYVKMRLRRANFVSAWGLNISKFRCVVVAFTIYTSKCACGGQILDWYGSATDWFILQIGCKSDLLVPEASTSQNFDA